MPDLIEPVTMPARGSTLAAWMDTLEQMQLAVGAEVNKAARSLVGSSREWLEYWGRLCKEVAAGQTKQVHAQRGDVIAGLRASLDALKRMHKLVRNSNHGNPESDDLLTDIAALEKLHAKLANRWQSCDDLEFLAVEDYPLSGSILKAIVASHPPPQEWYNE